MSLLWTLLTAALVSPGAADAGNDKARLSALVGEIRSADYRGDRAELRRLAGAIEDVRAEELRAAVAYWKGFAWWRRGINGFNETPTPDDLRGDLEAAAIAFRAALERQPNWIEARAGLSGCLMNQAFLPGTDEARRKPLLEELRPLWRSTSEDGVDNPRVLWLLGGVQLAAPPPSGGDVARAEATMRRGLEAARREALAGPAPDGWTPTWGAAENLMNLAYLHATATRRRALARAYAEGALALVPHWHYVRDILLPQIDALPGEER